MLRELLARPEVTEVCRLRSSFGVMAVHGGNLERCTDVIAREVAERTDSSYYAVIQDPPLRHHIPSTAFDPAHSPHLDRFLGHVQVVIAVHGYGREDRFWDVLLGGRNRKLAAHVGAHLRAGIDDRFGVVDVLADIPKGLRGQHPANPVNLPDDAGVQIELPPTSRWNRAEAEWSDWQGAGRAPQVDQLIDVLANAIRSWPI
ncbi:MAG: poly-gamma-glutamate hydrolase family protein [Acidimicrobiales bacterium]